MERPIADNNVGLILAKQLETKTSTWTPVIAWLSACTVVFAWGINFVLAKHALNQFDIGQFNFFRFGGMVVLGWLVLLTVGGIRAVEAGDRSRLLIVAVVGFCGYVFGFSVGLHLTSAFSASLLLALVPLWIVVFTSFVGRRVAASCVVACLVPGCAGTVIFVSARTSVSARLG